RVALKIEKNVACRRLRKPRQSKPRYGRQGLVHNGTLEPALHLNSRLFACSLVALDCPTLRPPLQRQGKLSERCHRFYIALLQFSHLRLADTGDQRHVIVGPPPLITVTTPSARIAMFDRFGIRVTRDWRYHGMLQAVPDVPVICRV